MIISLVRDSFTEISTQGELEIDGQHYCWTLELPNKDGLPGSCIPQGTYKLAYLFSPRFARNMPHVLDIPNRSNILIHYGNTAEDTEGCVLIGNTRDTNFVGDSRNCFDAFLNVFLEALKAEQVFLQVIGGAQVPDSSGDIHMEAT